MAQETLTSVGEAEPPDSPAKETLGMLFRRKPEMTYADVTPKSVYQNRRAFLKGAGLASAAVLAGHGLWELVSPSPRAFAGYY